MFQSTRSRIVPELSSLVEDTDSCNSVFERLCGPTNQGLTVTSFLRSLSCLIDNATTMGDLMEIFQQYVKTDPRDRSGQDEIMSLAGFRNSLEQLCFLRKMREASQYRVSWILQQLEGRSDQDFGLTPTNAKAGFMFDPKILCVLKQMEPGLRDLFADHVWDKSRKGLQRPTWKSILKNDTKVAWGELQSVARTFSICPDLLSEEELDGIVSIMRNSELRGFSDRASGGVSLPGFEEFFCRCAVVASTRLQQLYPIDAVPHWTMEETETESDPKPNTEIYLYVQALFRDHMKLQERFIISDSESEQEVDDGFERDPDPSPRPPKKPGRKQNSSRPVTPTQVGFGSSSSRPAMFKPNKSPSGGLAHQVEQDKKRAVRMKTPIPPSSTKMSSPFPMFMKSAPALKPQRPTSAGSRIRPLSASAVEARRIFTNKEREPPLLPPKPNLFLEVQARLVHDQDKADPREVEERSKWFMPTPASQITRASRPLVIKEVMFVPDENLPEPVELIIQSAILNQNRGAYQLALIGFAKAEQLWQSVLSARSPRSGPEGPTANPTEITTFFLLCKASVLHSQGQDERAMSMFLEADDLISPEISREVPRHPLMASARSGMGAVCFYDGRFQLGMKCFEDAVSIRRAELGSDHPDTAMLWNNLGACQEMLGQFEKANFHYRLAHKVLVNQMGPSHPRTNAVKRNLNRLEGMSHGEVKNHLPLSLSFREDRKYLIPSSTFTIMATSKDKGKKKKKKKKKITGKKGKKSTGLRRRRK